MIQVVGISEKRFKTPPRRNTTGSRQRKRQAVPSIESRVQQGISPRLDQEVPYQLQGDVDPIRPALRNLRKMIRFQCLALATISLLTGADMYGSDPSALDGLPDILHDAKGRKVEASTLKGKYIGLYFSAHWCPPCRAFTPSLVQFGNRHSDDNFEVVFVSFDHSNSDKRRYIYDAKMPWLSIPGARSREIQALAERFAVESFPTLIVLAPDGSVLTTQGREEVSFAPDTALDEWKKVALARDKP